MQKKHWLSLRDNDVTVKIFGSISYQFDLKRKYFTQMSQLDSAPINSTLLLFEMKHNFPRPPTHEKKCEIEGVVKNVVHFWGRKNPLQSAPTFIALKLLLLLLSKVELVFPF